MANEINHLQLTKAALEVQASPIKTFLEPERVKMLERYCLYGDLIMSSTGAEHDHIAKYLRMPNGKLAPMGPQSTDEKRNVADWYYQFKHWYKMLVHEIRKGNVADTAQYLGAISHSIGDTTALPHALSPDLGLTFDLLKRLLPTKSKYRYMNLHNFLEDFPVKVDIAGFKPALLGNSIDEAAFHTSQRLSSLTNETLGLVLPALKAAYRNDFACLSRISASAYSQGSRLLAEIIATAFYIAGKSFCTYLRPIAAKEHLDSLIPYSTSGWVPGPYFFKAVFNSPCNFDLKMEPQPLKLRFNDSIKTYKKGFGTGVGAFIEYHLPKGVYKKLTADMGLNAILEQKVPLKIRFELDGKTVLEKRFVRHEDSLSLELDLQGAKHLRISIEPDGPYEKFGRVSAHFTMGNPLLCRKPTK